MPRMGLDHEAVVQAAVQLIEREGLEHFSMAKLAQSLNIRTASLYNHVENMAALFTDIGLESVARMVGAEQQAIAGKKGDDALFAIAQAYRSFALEHRELYHVVMGLQKHQNKVLELAAGQITEPILQVLAGYCLDQVQQIHWQRVLRAMMHGFVSHEEAGGFSHFPVNREESYHIAIQCVADALNAIRKSKEQGE